MNTKTTGRKGFYEEVIEYHCKKAADTGLYLEGSRGQNGYPWGITAYALAAKQLFQMQQDDISPITTQEAYDPLTVFDAFKASYEVKIPNSDGLFVGDYKLKHSAT